MAKMALLVPGTLILGIGAIIGTLLCRSAPAADLPPPPVLGPMTFGESVGPPATLTIACAGAWCQRTGDDLAQAFERAGWKVVRMNQGGLGIDGVRGVRVHPCDPAGAKLAAALLARRRPYEVMQEKCAQGDRDMFIILGEQRPAGLPPLE